VCRCEYAWRVHKVCGLALAQHRAVALKVAPGRTANAVSRRTFGPGRRRGRRTESADHAKRLAAAEPALAAKNPEVKKGKLIVQIT
jgi:hypothetical protein